MNLFNKYEAIKHIKYEIGNDNGAKVFIIPNLSGNPDMTNVLCLSDTSLEIWEMISNDYTVNKIINAICDKYNKDKDEVESDVTSFISGLVEKGYIKEIDLVNCND